MSTIDRIHAHEAGFAARINGIPFSGNPYSRSQSPSSAQAWSNGWDEADSIQRAKAQERSAELVDAIRIAAMDIPDGPMNRFANAVMAWVEAQS